MFCKFGSDEASRPVDVARERVARVDAARAGVDVFRQRVGIGRPELRHLPPFEHRIDEAAGVVVQLLVGGKVIEQVGARFPLS